MPTKLIIPGLNGSGHGHWQDHWLKDDPDSILVRQRDWSQPDLAEWAAQIERALMQYPGSLLIAHSLGAVVAASLAERPSRHLIAGALLVAPCDLLRAESLHPGTIGIGPMPATRLPFPSLLIASRNDPYMAFEAAQAFADGLGSDFVDLGRAGHINADSGYGRWTSGYRLAARLGRHSYRDLPHVNPDWPIPVTRPETG